MKPEGTGSATADLPLYNPDDPVAQSFFTDAAVESSENIYGPPLTAEPSIQGTQTGPFLGKPQAVGVVIDSEIDRPLIDPEKPLSSEPNTGPPKSAEWQDFFSRVILKLGVRLYTDFSFRGVDENIVEVHDLERIQMRKEERDIIARPFAEYATKNKFLRNHGREIVALTDSIESLMTIGIWARRVNRIAAKYRPKKQQRAQNIRTREPEIIRPREQANVSYGPDSGAGVVGTANGRIYGDFGIINPGGG